MDDVGIYFFNKSNYKLLKKMATYSEKLRDPRWQKQRLEIMNRDQFTCQQCLDKDTTLNVHHYAYKKGVEPWGYSNEMLVTLCENCHKSESEKRPALESEIIQLIREAKTNIYDLYEFIYYLKNAENVSVDFYSLSKRELNIKNDLEIQKIVNGGENG